MKDINRKLKNFCSSLTSDENISDHVKQLELINVPLYREKKKLKEKEVGSYISTSLLLNLYLVFIVLPVSIVALFSGSLLALGTSVLFCGIAALFLIAKGNSNRFKKSPMVNKSMFHQLFIGGSDTVWYSADFTIVRSKIMDVAISGLPCPIDVCYAVFKNNDNTSVIEITQAEALMYESYDIDSAAIGVCGDDIVDVYFFKKGEDFNKEIQKIS